MVRRRSALGGAAAFSSHANVGAVPDPAAAPLLIDPSLPEAELPPLAPPEGGPTLAPPTGTPSITPRQEIATSASKASAARSSPGELQGIVRVRPPSSAARFTGSTHEVEKIAALDRAGDFAAHTRMAQAPIALFAASLAVVACEAPTVTQLFENGGMPSEDGAIAAGGMISANGGGFGGAVSGSSGALATAGEESAASGKAGTPSGGAPATAGTGNTPSGGASSGSGGLADLGGAMGEAGDTSQDPDAPQGYVPAIVAVGYGGLRVVSRDGGRTWGDRRALAADGGDDENLLRAVTYGKGLWIATGWRLFTSMDGLSWIDRGRIADGSKIGTCNIVEGLAYHAGYFYAACPPWNSPGTVYRSTDGISWSKYAPIGDTQGHLFLTYRGNGFAAYGDSHASFVSSDALSWQTLENVERATYCEGAFRSESDCHDASWFDGVWLRAEWKGRITRSTDGVKFDDVYTDVQSNTVYQSRAMAAGYVAPSSARP